jgi:hypothetical protein
MAIDDTARPRRSRRNQASATDTPQEVTPQVATQQKPSDPPQPPTPPPTLEQAIENARTLVLEIRSVLHCLADVLLYADDDDSVMHAEVARSVEMWAGLAAEELDAVKIKPLIEALKQRDGGTPGNGQTDPADQGPYQVREPRPVYLAA